MTEFKRKGWVVYTPKHSNSGEEFIVWDSFASTRKRAIDSFCHDTVGDWNFWKKEFNYKLKRCEQTIKIL